MSTCEGKASRMASPGIVHTTLTSKQGRTTANLSVMSDPKISVLSQWRETFRAARVNTSPSSEALARHTKIARQIIVDGTGSFFGYELLYRNSDLNNPLGGKTGSTLTSISLSRAVLAVGLADKFSDTPLFVNVDTDMLMSPLVEAITSNIGVIELLESIHVNDKIIERVADLKQRGYRFALDDVTSLTDSRWNLMAYVDFVKIDMHLAHSTDMEMLIARVKSHKKIILAEKLETQDELQAAANFGFDLFQGYITRLPEEMAVLQLPACSREVLERMHKLLVSGVSSEAIAIAIAIARDPATVLHLWLLSGIYQDEAGYWIKNISDVIRSIPRDALKGWIGVLLLENSTSRNLEFCFMANKSARSLQLLAHRRDAGNFALANEAYFLGLLTHFKTLLKSSAPRSERVTRIQKILDQSRAGLCEEQEKSLGFFTHLNDLSLVSSNPMPMGHQTRWAPDLHPV